jgi:ATP-binding cassette subfamily B multidrug efflux pump
MLKIIKYLKEYSMTIVIIIALLVLQAYCDLSLPAYTSKIVDVGIQQGGIETTLPKVMRESFFDEILNIVTEEEGAELKASYELISKDTVSAEDYNNYLKQYPILTDENVYTLKTISSEDYDRLSLVMQDALLLSGFLSGNTDEVKALKEQLVAGMPENMADLSLMEIIGAMPKEQSNTIISSIKDKMSAMPESLARQSSIAATKLEYQNVGININKLQSNYISVAGIKMLGLAFLGMAATIMVGFLSARVAAGFGKNIRLKVFNKVIHFSNSEFDKYSTASLITRSTNDIQQVQMSIAMTLRMVIYAPILAVGGIIKVLNTNTSMSWIIALGVLLISIIMGTLLTIAMPKFKLMQKLLDRLNLVSREILTGLSVIRAFGKEKHEEERFEVANQDLTKTSLFVNRTMTFMMPAMTLVMNGLTVLILWKGAQGIDAGSMQVGDLMAFIQYTMQIIMSFLMLSMLSIILPRAQVSATRIMEIIDTDLSVVDPKKAESFVQSKKGYVEFENVSFSYPNADDNVLSNINFTAKPGETTAIIGSTGSGKSTLINLIPRFYDVTEGSIKVDGVDVRNVNQHDLRSVIGYVPQKGVLFTGTIDSNIRYGKEDLAIEQVEKAASIAQAKDFIDEKPDKYETAISQGGSNVSGGQKQRLSIARAIAKDPEIYIFDDSFSALDYKTDVTLRKALKHEIKDSTVIIVAQRISTILHADQILVLDDGKVVGKGTHAELLKSCEEYRQIASSQLSKEELAYE